MICHAKKKDGSPCRSLAVYSDERGEFCGWHWSLLPEMVQSNLVSESPEMRDYINNVVAVQWKNDGRYNG